MLMPYFGDRPDCVGPVAKIRHEHINYPKTLPQKSLAPAFTCPPLHYDATRPPHYLPATHTPNHKPFQYKPLHHSGRAHWTLPDQYRGARAWNHHALAAHTPHHDDPGCMR